jgi:hypothetical protein
MTHLTEEGRPSTRTFLGVWEEAWQGRAEQERKVERYRTWLCSQGTSRGNAAERAVRVQAQGSQPRPFPSPQAAPMLPGLEKSEKSST